MAMLKKVKIHYRIQINPKYNSLTLGNKNNSSIIFPVPRWIKTKQQSDK